MSRIYLIKDEIVNAVMVTSETLEIAAEFCNGTIKGTKLPRDQRAIDFFCPYRQTEMRAENSDYIVKYSDKIFDVMPKEMFRALFEDIDDTPY